MVNSRICLEVAVAGGEGVDVRECRRVVFS